MSYKPQDYQAILQKEGFKITVPEVAADPLAQYSKTFDAMMKDEKCHAACELAIKKFEQYSSTMARVGAKYKDDAPLTDEQVLALALKHKDGNPPIISHRYKDEAGQRKEQHFQISEEDWKQLEAATKEHHMSMDMYRETAIATAKEKAAQAGEKLGDTAEEQNDVAERLGGKMIVTVERAKLEKTRDKEAETTPGLPPAARQQAPSR